MTELSPRGLAPLIAALRASWDRESAYEPDEWSPERPSAGQCAVTALIVQEVSGGEIVGARYVGGSHYWNIVDGVTVDLTASQFDELPTWVEGPGSVDRGTLLANVDTANRYEWLRRRVAEILGGGEA